MEDEDGLLIYYGGNGDYYVSFNFYPEGGHETGQSSCPLGYSKIDAEE